MRFIEREVRTFVDKVRQEAAAEPAGMAQTCNGFSGSTQIETDLESETLG